MKLTDILHKTCLIGLSYLDHNHQLLKQSLLAGSVTAIDIENGITITLISKEAKQKRANFILLSSLAPWFKAPEGIYRDENNNILIENPDYLVTWDIQRTQENKTDKDHQWWSWTPRTTPPSVG